MKAYHGDAALKRRLIAGMSRHMRLELLVREAGVKGEVAPVSTAYRSVLGVPTWLAQLEEKIFQRLHHDEAMRWPTQFLRAINVGSNLNLVWPRYALWLLDKEMAEYSRFTAPVSSLYQRWVAGGKPAAVKWRTAISRAYRSFCLNDDGTTADHCARLATYHAANARYVATDVTHCVVAAYYTTAANDHGFWTRSAASLLRLLRAAT